MSNSLFDTLVIGFGVCIFFAVIATITVQGLKALFTHFMEDDQ